MSTNPADNSIAVQYVHADHLGTPTLLTNQSGLVVADIEAEPFGETYVDYAEVTYNRRFPGQYKDEETGLHYNYFRDYDPTTGRYVQSDPRGVILDFSDPQRKVVTQLGLFPPGNGDTYRLNHIYGYVDQNPMIQSDATGEQGAVLIRYIPVAAKYFSDMAALAYAANMLCEDDERKQKEKEKSCRAVYDSMIKNTCAGIRNRRKQQRCWEAAAITYDGCVSGD